MSMHYLASIAPTETAITFALRRICFPLDPKAPPAFEKLLKQLDAR